jgi:hypothetical protein
MLRKNSLLLQLYQRKKCVSSRVKNKRNIRREMSSCAATKCRCLAEVEMSLLFGKTLKNMFLNRRTSAVDKIFLATYLLCVMKL